MEGVIEMELKEGGDEVGRQNRKLTNLCDGWIWRPWSNEGNCGCSRIVRHHRLLDRGLNHRDVPQRPHRANSCKKKRNKDFVDEHGLMHCGHS